MSLADILRRNLVATLTVGVIAVAGVAAARGGATVVDDAIWAHGELYGTVATPTSFTSPPSHTTDVIYSFGMNQVTGQRSVSEAAPGDRDYNGGRWRVKLAMFTPAGETYIDADNDNVVDFELTSAEEVLDYADQGYIEIVDTDVSFVCPLLP